MKQTAKYHPHGVVFGLTTLPISCRIRDDLLPNETLTGVIQLPARNPGNRGGQFIYCDASGYNGP